MTALPHSVSLVSRLIPAAEREGIIGDLIEAAGDRDIRGGRLTLWLLFECVRIAAGVSVDRARGSCLPPVREVALGLAVEGTRPFRRTRMGPVNALVSLLLIGASTVAIAFTAALLVGALFSASGLR
jgi:hypothetical protein